MCVAYRVLNDPYLQNVAHQRLLQIVLNWLTKNEMLINIPSSVKFFVYDSFPTIGRYPFRSCTQQQINLRPYPYHVDLGVLQKTFCVRQHFPKQVSQTLASNVKVFFHKKKKPDEFSLKIDVTGRRLTLIKSFPEMKILSFQRSKLFVTSFTPFTAISKPRMDQHYPVQSCNDSLQPFR